MASTLMDHPAGYGSVSRFFHWSMAALLLWQLISAALHVVDDEAAVTEFFFGFHFTNGVLLLCLAVLRGAWGLVNIPRRPAHAAVIDRLAVLGHIAMYVLLIAVPTVALIRAYGSDRPFSAFGITLFSGSVPEIEWMKGLGSEWHGFLGWILFLLIAGHVTMALIHDRVWKQPMIARMTKGGARQ